MQVITKKSPGLLFLLQLILLGNLCAQTKKDSTGIKGKYFFSLGVGLSYNRVFGLQGFDSHTRSFEPIHLRVATAAWNKYIRMGGGIDCAHYIQEFDYDAKDNQFSQPIIFHHREEATVIACVGTFDLFKTRNKWEYGLHSGVGFNWFHSRTNDGQRGNYNYDHVLPSMQATFSVKYFFSTHFGIYSDVGICKSIIQLGFAYKG